jgi:hypothetical protein
MAEAPLPCQVIVAPTRRGPARIEWNVPQIWRADSGDDAKLLRAVAGRLGLRLDRAEGADRLSARP